MEQHPVVLSDDQHDDNENISFSQKILNRRTQHENLVLKKKAKELNADDIKVLLEKQKGMEWQHITQHALHSNGFHPLFFKRTREDIAKPTKVVRCPNEFCQTFLTFPGGHLKYV